MPPTHRPVGRADPARNADRQRTESRPREYLHSQVLEHHTSRFNAEKIIRGIHCRCNQCGREVWCDMDGRAKPEERFELPGMELAVCHECQRQMVMMKLVGE